MKVETFNELVLVCDQRSHWVWNTVTNFLEKRKLPFIQLDPEASLRESWARVRNSPKSLIHWESGKRIGGAIVEEILEINPRFDIEEKLLIITSDPNSEDQVYFAELGITNVLEMRNNAIDIKKSIARLDEQLLGELTIDLKQTKVWRKLLLSLNQVTEKTPQEQLTKIRQQIEKVGSIDQKNSARYFNALGEYNKKTGQSNKAEEYWRKALDINPNYHPAQRNMIDIYCINGEHEKALTVLKQLQNRNKNNLSRLVKMGEIHQSLNDHQKAEHYFLSALEKDQNCGSALNGLASLRFAQGNLEESRALLAKSALASQVASSLNREGITLVRAKRYEEALSHYSKAQYVLPHQDKSPMLFYNMGLCYSRWGKVQSAKQFLQLALIKEPNYKKAQKLLEQINAS